MRIIIILPIYVRVESQRGEERWGGEGGAGVVKKDGNGTWTYSSTKRLTVKIKGSMRVQMTRYKEYVMHYRSFFLRVEVQILGLGLGFFFYVDKPPLSHLGL